MPRAAHKSAISFGLIYIPIELYKSTRDTSVSFNQLCKDTHERVKYKKICPSCNKEVSTDGIVKGYEYEKGKYVIFEDNELEKLKSAKDKTLHILHFAKMSDIDNIYYDKNYYVVPMPGGEEAFELLRQSMFTQKKVAIAQTVMGTKEELIVLYPTKEGILAKLLFYQEEIQLAPSIKKVTLDKNKLSMTKTIIDSMTQTFDASLYVDEHQEKIRGAIQAKIEKREIIASDNNPHPNIINIMDALQRTAELAQKGQLTGTA